MLRIFNWKYCSIAQEIADTQSGKLAVVEPWTMQSMQNHIESISKLERSWFDPLFIVCARVDSLHSIYWLHINWKSMMMIRFRFMARNCRKIETFHMWWRKLKRKSAGKMIIVLHASYHEPHNRTFYLPLVWKSAYKTC